MKQIITKQLAKLGKDKIDLVIFSTGYEKRCTYIAGKFDFITDCNTKFCFAFPNNDAQSKLNRNFFLQRRYEIVNGDGDTGIWIEKLLDLWLNKNEIKNGELNILIDYSSMTRVWYATILRFFYYANLKATKINLTFCYAFAKYTSPPMVSTRNIHVSPLDGYSAFSLPDKPTALILGLGYEPEKAYGLTEFFDAETYLFYNDTSSSSKFSKAVEEINKYIINSVPPENVFKYPIGDLIFTEKLLSDLCRALNETHRIVIAPTGPKPFTLLSLMTSLKFNQVDVWRISPGTNATPIDREPNEMISIFQITLLS